MNQLKTILLLGVLSLILIGIGSAIGGPALWISAALAVFMNIGAYFWSDRLVLRMNRARIVERAECPELYDMVKELSATAGIPAPRLALIDDDQPNAFATGRNPAHGVVAVTSGIVRALNARELRGVLAHEIAHIKNRDILVSSIAATAASMIASVADMFMFSALFGGGQSEDEEGGANPFLLMLVAPIAATLVQLGISRSREYMADATGAKISGDPEALASALLKLEAHAQVLPAEAARPATASLFIVNPFGGRRSFASWFSTHPPVRERVERLLTMARGTQRGVSGVAGFSRI